MITLSDRILTYEDAFNYKATPRLPIIAKCEIKNFIKLINKLDKPFCSEFYRICRDAMYFTAIEIEGAIFAYHNFDEIIFIIKNDIESDSLSYSNKIQKINSTITSILSTQFFKNYLASDNPPDLIGEPIFETLVFTLPSTSEVVNYLLYKQQACVYYSIGKIAEFELLKAYDSNVVRAMLSGKSLIEKKYLIEQECDIVFDKDYPMYFTRGTFSYKVPRVIKNDIESDRKKWYLDLESVDILNDRDFVSNIIHSGSDILRLERDIT